MKLLAFTLQFKFHLNFGQNCLFSNYLTKRLKLYNEIPCVQSENYAVIYMWDLYNYNLIAIIIYTL